MFVAVERHFTTNGRTGNQGVIQQVEINESGCYYIEALGAAGGIAASKYDGGVGARVSTKEIISKDTTLNVVVGHHGGANPIVRMPPHVHMVYSRCLNALFMTT